MGVCMRACVCDYKDFIDISMRVTSNTNKISHCSSARSLFLDMHF